MRYAWRRLTSRKTKRGAAPWTNGRKTRKKEGRGGDVLFSCNLEQTVGSAFRLLSAGRIMRMDIMVANAFLLWHRGGRKEKADLCALSWFCMNRAGVKNRKLMAWTLKRRGEKKPYIYNDAWQLSTTVCAPLRTDRSVRKELLMYFSGASEYCCSYGTVSFSIDKRNVAACLYCSAAFSSFIWRSSECICC